MKTKSLIETLRIYNWRGNRGRGRAEKHGKVTTNATIFRKLSLPKAPHNALGDRWVSADNELEGLWRKVGETRRSSWRDTDRTWSHNRAIRVGIVVKREIKAVDLVWEDSSLRRPRCYSHFLWEKRNNWGYLYLGNWACGTPNRRTSGDTSTRKHPLTVPHEQIVALSVD